MDFYGIKRKKLQNLCRKHGIPANLKNNEMADKLTSAFKEKENENDVLGKELSSEDSLHKDCCIDENLVVKKATKKVKFRSENEVFEFTRSVKKHPRRSDRLRGESYAQDVQDAEKGVRRSKQNAANGVSGDDASEPVQGLQAEKACSRSSCDATQGHKIVRRLKRIACSPSGQDEAELVIDKLYTDGQGRVTEQPHVRSSQLAGKDHAIRLSLGIKVKELQMEVNPRDDSKLEKTRRPSTRISADVKEPIMEGETKEVETLFSAKDSKGEGKTRRSKRFAASNKAEGEYSVKNNVKELLVDNEVLRTAIQPRKNILDGSEVENVPRRSRRLGDNVNALSAVPESNNNELIQVDGKSSKQGDVEVEKAPRRSKRLGPNDGSQGARKIHVSNAHTDGQTEKREQPPKDYSVHPFQDRKLLRRSKSLAVDNNDVQVGANFNNSNMLVKDQNQITAEQHGRFTDDSPQLGKVVRRLKKLAASEDEQIGDLGINVVGQQIEDKSQAESKRTRKCTQVGLEAENNLRRSIRFAATYGKGAEGSVDEMKHPQTNNEDQVPMRPTSISSRHNSKKARIEVEESMAVKKTDEELESLPKPHAKAPRKMKRDISGTSKVNAEVVSSQSSVTLEELSAVYGDVGPDAASIGNGTEISCTKLTARRSSKKRKIADQECTMEKPQELIDVSPSLSATEPTKPVMGTENISDPHSKKSDCASEGMDSQQLSSVQGRRIQDEKIDHTETTSLLLRFPDKDLFVGENDNDSGVKSEVKKGTANSKTVVNLHDETGGQTQTTSVQLEEIELKAQVVVDSAHVLPKDSASMCLTKRDTITNMENLVSALEFDLNASSGAAKEITEAAQDVKKGSRENNLSVQIEVGEIDNKGAEELIERNIEEDKLPEHECLVMDPKTSETIAVTEKGSVENNFLDGDFSGHVEIGEDSSMTMIHPSTNHHQDLEKSGPSSSIHSPDLITGDESENKSAGEFIETSTTEEEESPAETLDQSEEKYKDYETKVMSDSGLDSEERSVSTSTLSGDSFNTSKSISQAELAVQNGIIIDEQVPGEKPLQRRVTEKRQSDPVQSN
ncbi:PREDICTED: uncharacterized protein LOC104812032 isoform X2 [Tarenaya hassleriana]|uniref:uncharacterized protein LOC104812032 isoform X2 n=1 Tax=Tarenaya hassleriana TaxID=28532 RepID=UPI00053C48E1|nr:PREDICTED: uncharacterized protein LOC104812032 isoform X2 [Tarenaya hassleriana]